MDTGEPMFVSLLKWETAYVTRHSRRRAWPLLEGPEHLARRQSQELELVKIGKKP